MPVDLLGAQARIRRETAAQNSALADLRAWVAGCSPVVPEVAISCDVDGSICAEELPPPRSRSQAVAPADAVASERAAGAAAYARGAHGEAVAAFSRALRAQIAEAPPADQCVSRSTCAAILSSRAQCHLALRAYGEAVADATAALRADSSLVKAWQRRAVAAAAQGRPAAAVRDLSAAAALLRARREEREKGKVSDKRNAAEGSGSADGNSTTAKADDVADREVTSELRRCSASVAEAARVLAREEPTTLPVTLSAQATKSDASVVAALLPAAITLDVCFEEGAMLQAAQAPSLLKSTPFKPAAQSLCGQPPTHEAMLLLPPIPPQSTSESAPAHLRTAPRSTAEFERAWRSVGGAAFSTLLLESSRATKSAVQAAFFLLFTMTGESSPCCYTPLCFQISEEGTAAAASMGKGAGASMGAVSCIETALAARMWPPGLFRCGIEPDALVSVIAVLRDVVASEKRLVAAVAALPYYPAPPRILLQSQPKPQHHDLDQEQQEQSVQHLQELQRELGLRTALTLCSLSHTPRLSLAVRMLAPADREMLHAAAFGAAAAALTGSKDPTSIASALSSCIRRSSSSAPAGPPAGSKQLHEWLAGQIIAAISSSDGGSAGNGGSIGWSG